MNRLSARQTALLTAAAPAIVAAAATVAIWLSGVRGVDHAAHAFRVDLYRDYGLTLWNTQWFGGHHTLGYGLLFPVLAGLTSLAIVGIVSTVAAVGLFGAILRRTAVPGLRSATIAFTILIIINFYEGRLPFVLGVALGLGALLALLHRRWVLAVIAGVLAGLAAPLAAAFLALACGAWAIAEAPRQPLKIATNPIVWVGIVGLVPATFFALAFPEGGRFPFLGVYFVLTVIGALAATRVRDPDHRVVVAGGALLLVVSFGFFFAPNPVGANLWRFAVLGGPVLLAVGKNQQRVVSYAGLLLVFVQLQPLVELPMTAGNPATEASYHQPMIDAVLDRSEGPVRIEVPFTEQHWETAHIAPHVALARGWQRQLDYRFHEDTLLVPDLDDAGYRAWLAENGVSFVAVPDIALEPLSRQQARLAANSPGLVEVWSNSQWILYEVVDAAGLIEPFDGVEASLDVVEPDRVEVTFSTAGAALVRVRHSRHMAVSSGNGCTADQNGWTLVQATEPGRVVVGADWFGGPEVCTIANG